MSKRPEEPILDADPNDVKAFYHNVAYKVNRAAINLAKKEILEDRLTECFRTEGANAIDKCEELTKHFQAAVRVVQAGAQHSRKRNIGNVMAAAAEPATA